MIQIPRRIEPPTFMQPGTQIARSWGPHAGSAELDRLQPFSPRAESACGWGSPRAVGLSTAPRAHRWAPAPDLAPYIGEYYLEAVGTTTLEPRLDGFHPGEGHLRVVVSGGSGWRVRPAGGAWLRPAPVSLFGPSSTLIWSEASPAVLLGARIRPRGWLRFLGGSARDWANRIDQPSPLGACDLQAFHAGACALTEDGAVPELFDRLFRRLLGPPVNGEAAVERIEAALADPANVTVAALAGTAGLSIRAIERLAGRAFGFAPKLLLRRARFLRSLEAVSAVPRGERACAIDPSYTDYSHFIRDSHDFLGSTPQAFLDRKAPSARLATGPWIGTAERRP